MQPWRPRVQIGWNKFRQLVPLLTNRDKSLIRRGRLYSSCVQSSMLHRSETWPVRKENEVGLFHLDMSEQLQNTESNVIFATPLKIQRLKSCQLQGALPGALASGPHCGLYHQTLVTSLHACCVSPTFQHLPWSVVHY